eukprot:CAMPEP_0196594300 /NCGR_PEP_ID=MMETSP1081-20130531/77942_1 /TAXON_ID=36882 /ORGANISM="Pyramimonas amylifera, Strain CCMP720" /LENGTH=468 /DNA_ID=CAMNT_0041918525 /DNA_START=777 /DNA_END=2184 /DNA_ORIENTATION=+
MYAMLLNADVKPEVVEVQNFSSDLYRNSTLNAVERPITPPFTTSTLSLSRDMLERSLVGANTFNFDSRQSSDIAGISLQIFNAKNVFQLKHATKTRAQLVKESVSARNKKALAKTTRASLERRSTWSKPRNQPCRVQKLGLGNLSTETTQEKTSQTREEGDHMSTFLREIGNTGLLTKEQEVSLATLAQDFSRLEKIQSDFKEEFERAPSFQEWAMRANTSGRELRERLDKGRRAQKLMVEHNVRLVVHVARRHVNRGVPMGDLVQEGMNGLIKAIHKFKPEKGFRFSTYAHYWIRQGVSRAISDQSRTIRLPVHVHDTLSKIRKARSTLEDGGLQGTPTNASIANHLGMDEAKVSHLLQSALPLVALDGNQFKNHSKDEGETSSMIDAVQNEDTEDRAPETICERGFLNEDLQAALSSLHPRERNILCMRYGLASADGSTMNLKQMAERMDFRGNELGKLRIKLYEN